MADTTSQLALGESTGPQSAQQQGANFMGIPLVGTNGSGWTRSQMPGPPPPPPGNPSTYRAMLSHQTVSLAAAIISGQLATAVYNFRLKEGAPQAWLDAVEAAFKATLYRLVRDCWLGVWFGWAPFEVIWDVGGDGLKVPVRFKPLLPDATKALVDAFGNVVGLQNTAPDGSRVALAGPKAFYWTNEPMYGDPYGTSRLEPARTSWNNSLFHADRLGRSINKAAGFVVQLHYPVGTSKDASGGDRDNAQLADDILAAVTAGRSVKFPNLYAATNNPAEDAALAGKAAWLLSVLEIAGGNAIAETISALSDDDKAIFAGMGLSPRTGLESQRSGSRADSQTHTETATQHAQMIVDDIARTISTGPVDAMLVENFGEAARGGAYLSVEQIESNRQATGQALLTAMIADPNVGPTIVAKIDTDKLLAEQDVAVNAVPTPIVPLPPKPQPEATP